MGPRPTTDDATCPGAVVSKDRAAEAHLREVSLNVQNQTGNSAF
jgi:hypothetical protein